MLPIGTFSFIFLLVVISTSGQTHNLKKGCDEACQIECLKVHNTYRANFGAKPLVHDERLATQAQAQISKGILAHSDWLKTNKGGENIAWGSIFPTYASAIKSWHDEETYYNFQTGESKTPSQVIKNFLQVVWKDATRIGCARGTLYGKPWYIVHYDKQPHENRPELVKLNVGLPIQDDMAWYRDSSPYAQVFEHPKRI